MLSFHFVVKTTVFFLFLGYTKLKFKIYHSGGNFIMNAYPYVKNIEHEKVLKIADQGETLVMPAKKPHSVHAMEAFKMMLVVIFPLEQD